MKCSIPAAIFFLAASGGAHAQVPESWWSMPLGPEMHRTVAKDVQTALVNLDCYSGPVDGIVGPRTTRGIRDWQRINDFPVTGIVSEPLVQTLLTQQSRSCPRR